MRWTRCCGGCACQLADGREHYPPMPKQDADIFEVVISQMRECRNTNPVLGKTLRILGHTELIEPLRNLLHCGALSDAPCDAQVEDYPNQRL